MDDTRPLWPDDQKIGSVDGPMYQMGSGHRYVIARTLLNIRPNIVNEGRVAMTRHVLEHSPDALPILFASHNIDSILQRRPLSTREKAWRLFSQIVKETKGKPGILNWTFSPSSEHYLRLLRSVGLDLDDEVIWLLKYLEGLGYITFGQHSDGGTIRLPVEGLIAFEAENSLGETIDAFVAMWFSDEVASVYDLAMIPAIERWGYRALRVDRHEHNNKIDDEIIASIRRSKFLVADFSCGPDGARGGVYYEAGYAAGLGKPVIFTVRASDLSRVHFDTRQYNHIVWEDPEQLRIALENRIGATIGEAAVE